MPWYSASRRALRSSTTSITAAGDLGDPSSSLKVRSFSFRCLVMMAVEVLPAPDDEFAVLAECVVLLVVVVAVLVALVPPVPVPLAPEQLLLPCDSIRSSFMARLASSVSTVAVVAAEVLAAATVVIVEVLVVDLGDNGPGGGEVGEVVDVGDFSGIGISRSIDF